MKASLKLRNLGSEIHEPNLHFDVSQSLSENSDKSKKTGNLGGVLIFRFGWRDADD